MLRVLMWRPWIYAELDYFHFPDKETAQLSLFQLVSYYFKFISDRIEKRYGEHKVLGLFVRGIISAVGGGNSNGDKSYDYVADSGYFNVQNSLKFAPLLLNPITRRFFFPLLAIAVSLRKGQGMLGSLKLLTDYALWSLKGGERKEHESIPSLSLRKIVKIVPSGHRTALEDPMRPLREGR